MQWYGNLLSNTPYPTQQTKQPEKRRTKYTYRAETTGRYPIAAVLEPTPISLEIQLPQTIESGVDMQSTQTCRRQLQTNMNLIARERHKPPDVKGVAPIDGNHTTKYLGPTTSKQKSYEIKTHRTPERARHLTGHPVQQYSRTRRAK